MIVNPIGQLYFRFIGMSVVGLAIGLGRTEGLVINRAVLTRTDVAISLSGWFV